MYKLTAVTKLYQKGRHTVRAVRDLDLVISDGEWLAVQGRTGHGKSTHGGHRVEVDEREVGAPSSGLELG